VTRPMAKVVEIRREPLLYSIPLAHAVFCENCVTISNSRPNRCGVCGSEAVLRLETILNRTPDPSPVRAMAGPRLFQLTAISA
jgi:hypothetical protein